MDKRFSNAISLSTGIINLTYYSDVYEHRILSSEDYLYLESIVDESVKILFGCYYHPYTSKFNYYSSIDAFKGSKVSKRLMYDFLFEYQKMFTECSREFKFEIIDIKESVFDSYKLFNALNSYISGLIRILPIVRSFGDNKYSKAIEQFCYSLLSILFYEVYPEILEDKYPLDAAFEEIKYHICLSTNRDLEKAQSLINMYMRDYKQSSLL